MRTGIKSTEKYLEISRELFYDGLPRDKAVDKDIGGTKVMWGDILLDERLRTRYGRALLASTGD